MLTPSILTLAAEAGLNPESHVLPHYLFGSTWLTNHHVMSVTAAVLGIVVFALAARKLAVGDQVRPSDYLGRGAGGNLLETLCEFLRRDVVEPMLGKATDRYIYYVWSVFFFILLGNLLGMIPIGPVLGLTLGEKFSHVGGTFTGNVNFTAGLAIVSLCMIIGIGLRENGLGFFGHMWPVPLSPWYLSPLLLVVGLLIFALEIVGLGIKSFALCIRLFANMVAGHMVLASLIIMIVTGANYAGKGMTLLGAAALSFMELFVAFLQAYIFTFLTVIFISLGATHHDDHEHEHSEGYDPEGHTPGHAEPAGTHG
ncbi:MAG: F0F1 ATP synthase subunit A [Phycisphaeraceae bacterium]|nr:F0F1 ATP synthase subunit A [Phycisphaeraceae bacterium]